MLLASRKLLCYITIREYLMFSWVSVENVLYRSCSQVQRHQSRKGILSGRIHGYVSVIFLQKHWIYLLIRLFIIVWRHIFDQNHCFNNNKRSIWPFLCSGIYFPFVIYDKVLLESLSWSRSCFGMMLVSDSILTPTLVNVIYCCLGKSY